MGVEALAVIPRTGPIAAYARRPMVEAVRDPTFGTETCIVVEPGLPDPLVVEWMLKRLGQPHRFLITDVVAEAIPAYHSSEEEVPLRWVVRLSEESSLVV